MTRFFVILLCLSIIATGCSDYAINNAVAPPTEERVKMANIQDQDNTLRMTGKKTGPFEWFVTDGDDVSGVHAKWVWTAEFQGEEVWLCWTEAYIADESEFAIGVEIEEPVIVSDVRRKSQRCQHRQKTHCAVIRNRTT